MSKRTGLIGTKIGNSSFYDDSGKSLPVTILKIDECIVSDIKTIEKHGYSSLQLVSINEKKEIIKLKKGPIQPLEHLNCFNNKSLKILFGKNGFKSMSIFKIITTFLRTKRFDYHSIRYILVLIKNSLLSTKINFIKIK